MKTFFSLLFLFVFQWSYTQSTYEKAEGYYNLSEFEVASGLYLLKNHTFFYFASFGNVDLKIYGTYEISDKDVLLLNVDDELKKEFYVYGFKTERPSEIIHIDYEEPYDNKTENLYLKTKSKRIQFPKFSSDNSTVSIEIPAVTNTLLSIGYTYLNKDTLSTTVNLDGMNSLVIYHNYYYDMIMEVSKMSFILENNQLKQTGANSKSYVKKNLKEDVIQQVNDFIITLKNRTSITRNSIIYLKL